MLRLIPIDGPTAESWTRLMKGWEEERLHQEEGSVLVITNSLRMAQNHERAAIAPLAAGWGDGGIF
jgi:hypothetical protein